MPAEKRAGTSRNEMRNLNISADLVKGNGSGSQRYQIDCFAILRDWIKILMNI